MSSIHSIAIRNSQAVRMIRNRQYSEAQDLLEQGLMDLEECDWLPEDDGDQHQEQSNLTTSPLLRLQTFAVKQESRGSAQYHSTDFCSYDKAFVFAVVPAPLSLGQEQEDAPRISSYEYAVISCVLWFNTGLAARLCRVITNNMAPARISYECALEHLDALTCGGHPSSPGVLLLQLAVLNNAGYTMYRLSMNNDHEGDKEEAMDRLDQMKDNWMHSIRRGLDIPRKDAAVFVSNLEFQQEQRQPHCHCNKKISRCSAAA